MSYSFVPLPPTVNRVKRDHARLDRHQWIVRLRPKLRVLAPVHIGSGTLDWRQGEVVRQGARVSGAPGIPGSSLKGLLRARFEAITMSCCRHADLRPRRLGKKLPSRSFPGYEVEFHKHIQQKLRGCGGGRASCVACALFGKMGIQGRLRVQDFRASRSAFEQIALEPRYSPRPHHLGDFREEEGRLVVTRLHGRKFHHPEENATPPPQGELAEAIPRGAQLEGAIVVVNPSPSELGGLLSACGYCPPSTLRIGSGKPQGLGVLTVESMEIDVRRNSDLVSIDAQQVDSWRRDFTDSADYWLEGEEALVAIANVNPQEVP